MADHVALLKHGQIDFAGGLDDLKDEVKRLRIRAAQPIPKNFQCEGLLSCETTHNEAILSVRGFTPETKAYLEQSLKAEVYVENLNLEEIFLELNR